MRQFPEEQNESGAFERQEDAFRDWAAEPEAGRYHLYICKACPWAHRAWVVLRLMGLDGAVGVSAADPIRDEQGWAFREGDGHGMDGAEGFQYLSEAYRATDSNFDGRVTVPVLWDKRDKRIVNNSEDDICRMWVEAFKPLAAHPVDLFPDDLRAEQEALSQRVYENLNNGVYEAGFATSQSAYESGYRKVFGLLDELEERLSTGGPYLFGDRIVETDWRAFCTLIRFDAVYHGHFKCNKRRIVDYPALQAYLERLYRHDKVAETVNLDHIKRHYYFTHDDINPTRIVPVGPDLHWMERGGVLNAAVNRKETTGIDGERTTHRSFDPAAHGFVYLPDHRPPGGVRFYERRNHSCVNGDHDYRRLNIYLSQDGDYVTIWFGLLEGVFVDALFRDHGIEPPEYDETYFRGYIESEEQALWILKAIRRHDELPQVLRSDPAKGIVCEMLKEKEQ